MKLWVIDPTTKKSSVSLSMLMVTFTAALAAMGLEMSGKIQHTSIATELFYATAALYFSRRFNIKGRTFSSETTEGPKE